MPRPADRHQHGDSRYGIAVACAWDRVHPRLTHRAAWLDHDGNLPVIEGTLIRLPQFGPLRAFTMANSDYPNHVVLARDLQAYLRWGHPHARAA